MTLLLLLGRGTAFISQYLWPAVALGFLAVVIAPAIWSRHRDRQRAALAVIGIILQSVTAVVVTRRHSHYLWQDLFATTRWLLEATDRSVMPVPDPDDDVEIRLVILEREVARLREQTAPHQL